MKKLIFVIAITLLSISSSFAYVAGSVSAYSTGTFDSHSATYYNVNRTSINYFIEASIGHTVATIYGQYYDANWFSASVSGGTYSSQKSGTFSKSGTTISWVFIEATANPGTALAQWGW